MDVEAPAIFPLKFFDFHSNARLESSSADVPHPDAFASDDASISCAVHRAFGAPLRSYYDVTDRALDRLARAA